MQLKVYVYAKDLVKIANYRESGSFESPVICFAFKDAGRDDLFEVLLENEDLDRFSVRLSEHKESNVIILHPPKRGFSVTDYVNS